MRTKAILGIWVLSMCACSGASQGTSTETAPAESHTPSGPITGNVNDLQGHCTAEEKPIFSCRLTGSGDGRVLSVCASEDLSASSGYVQLRDGPPNAPEFTHPSGQQGTQQAFVYASAAGEGTSSITLKADNAQHPGGWTRYEIVSESTGSGHQYKLVRSNGSNTEEAVCQSPVVDRLMQLQNVVRQEH